MIRRGISLFFSIVLVLTLFSNSIIETTKAVTIHYDDNHEYKSKSINIELGEVKSMKVSDIVAHYNANEAGYLNSIQPDAWIYTYSNADSKTTGLTTRPLTTGASITLAQHQATDGMLRTFDITGTGKGCSRIEGKLAWSDLTKYPPDDVYYYKIGIGVYVHAKATGFGYTSDTSNGSNPQDVYIYENEKARITTTVYPFNSQYLDWDKVSNNAIQQVSASINLPDVANITDRCYGTWGQSWIDITGKSEGVSVLTLRDLYKHCTAQDVRIHIFKKPILTLSKNSLTLSQGVFISDEITAQVSNAGNDSNRSFTWVSDNPDIVEISNPSDASPVLITKKTGTTNIKCIMNDSVAIYNKNVSPIQKSISVTVVKEGQTTTQEPTTQVPTTTIAPTTIQKTTTLLNTTNTSQTTDKLAKQTITVKAKKSIKYGRSLINLKAKTSGNGKLTYKSSNTKVIKVDKKGRLKRVGYGTAKITITAAGTAKYKKAKKDVKITVKENKCKITKIAVRGKKIYVYVNTDEIGCEYDVEFSLGSDKTVVHRSISKKDNNNKRIFTFEFNKTSGALNCRVRTTKTRSGQKLKINWSNTKSFII